MATKRQLDPVREPGQSPPKRVRLTQEDAQQPGLEGCRLEEDKTALRHPRPRALATFLNDYVDPVQPDCSESVHTLVADWLESVVPGREKRCRSEGYLRASGEGQQITWELTRSAPAMAGRDSDEFAIPSAPSSSRGRRRGGSHAGSAAPSYTTDAMANSGRSSGQSSASRLIENPFYRDDNLALNHVHIRHPLDPAPDHVERLVDYMRRDRTSPGPSVEEIGQYRPLYQLELGSGESQVEEFVRDNILPSNSQASPNLARSFRQPMARHTVPNTGSTFRVSNPVPDIAYGYDFQTAFGRYNTQLSSMGSEANGRANNPGLMYPFFVIEFKGDGAGGRGPLWVATNRCLGGSASCVRIAENLNRQLSECRSPNIRRIDSAAFSVAMNGTEARLFISWKADDLAYHTRQFGRFILQKPGDYLEFRRYVRNIIDWGADRRLRDIHGALDALLEEGGARA